MMIKPLFVKIKTIPNWDKMELAGYPAMLDDIPSPKDLVLESDETIAYLLYEYGVGLLHYDHGPVGNNYVSALLDELGDRENLPETENQIELLREEDKKLTAKMALTPELCKLAAIAVACGEDGNISSALIHPDEYTEVDALELFWRTTIIDDGVLLQRKIVGYNQTKFDLAVILTRSAMLGVDMPRGRIDPRPWGHDVIDLAECREKYLFWGKENKKSLRFMAQAYELDSLPVYTEIIDEFNNGEHLTGEDTLSDYETQPAIVQHHNSNDLYWCQQLYAKMKGRFFVG